MSRHNRTRRRPHRHLSVEAQQAVAASNAAIHAARYPRPPVYTTHVSSYSGPKDMVGPVLLPVRPLPATRWDAAKQMFRLIVTGK